ncbi:MAG: VWA domain-containing protein [Candidatus Contendobacter sp.]|nr:VWA domain-containing protein [Candidatus Contendobacter sp.]
MNHHLARTRLFHFIALIVLLAGALPPVVRALADTPSSTADDVNACHSLDLVVLVDQSASMRNNDTSGQRLEVAKVIIENLGNHAILLCPGQDIVHRIAVYGFGDLSRYLGPDNNYIDDTSEYLTPQSIPLSYDHDDWIRLRDSLKDQLNAFRNDNLAYTDHKSALLRARDVLKMWKDQPVAGAEDRRQAILLITDGEPCTGSGGCSTDSAKYQFDKVAYMNDLIAIAQPSGADFPYAPDNPADTIFISMVALADNSQTYNYRTDPTFRNAWQTIIGQRGQIYDTQESNLDLTTGMFNVLRPLIGSNLQEWECGKPINVIPYLDNSLVININRQPADPGVDPATISVFLDVQTGDQAITLEGGEQVWADGTRQPLPPNIEYTADGGSDGVVINENYAFTNPWPGVYNVRTEGGDVCKDIKVNYGKGSVTAEILHPAADTVLVQTPQEPYYDELAPEHLSLSVLDIDTPLQEIEGFPLLIHADIAGPKNNQSMGQLVLGSTGVYDSVDPILVRDSGDYTWTAIGCVQSPTGIALLSAQGRGDAIVACPWAAAGENLVQVFRSEGVFAVYPVSFFTWRVTTPADGDRLAMNSVQGSGQSPAAIPVVVELIEEGGEPLAVDAVFNAPAEALRAELYKIGSDTPVESILLNPTGPGAKQLTGQFANTAQAGAGDYRIVVRPNWAPSAINRAEFAPQSGFDVAEVGHVQYEIYPLDMRITPPSDITLHRTTIPQCFLNPGDCFGNAIQPFDFHVELVNMKTGQIVPLAEALADVNAAHTLTVAAPSGVEETVTLKPLEAANLQRLQASGAGATLDESGEYTIEAVLADIALRDGFQWADTRRAITFAREDTLMTNPLLAKGAVILVGLILLALLIWFIYAHTGGPSGTLTYEFTNSVGQTQEAANWSLSKWKRVNKLKSNNLKDHGVGSPVKVKRAQPVMKDGVRAIYIEAVDINGMTLFADIIEEGDAPGFNDGRLRYGEIQPFGRSF